MAFEEFIGFKFFLLVWNHPGHLEEEPGLGLLLDLLLLLLVVVGGVEHIRRVGSRGGVLGRVPEGEHVEGGGGGAVQHPAHRVVLLPGHLGTVLLLPGQPFGSIQRLPGHGNQFLV